MLMKKSFLLIFLILAGVSAVFAGDFKSGLKSVVNGVVYITNVDGTATVSGHVDLLEKAVIQIEETVLVESVEYKVSSVGKSAFYKCAELSEIDIPASVKVIDEYAFNLSGLSKVTLHEGLDSIKRCSFSEISLESLILPTSVRYIEGAFNMDFKIPDGGSRNDYHIKKVEIADGNPYFIAKDGFIYSADMTEILYCQFGNKLSRYEMPESVTSLGDNSIRKLEADTILLSPNLKHYSTSVAYHNKFGIAVVPEKIFGFQALIAFANNDYVFGSCKQSIWLTTKNTYDIYRNAMGNTYGKTVVSYIPPQMKNVYVDYCGKETLYKTPLYQFNSYSDSLNFYIQITDVIDSLVRIESVEFEGEKMKNLGDNKFSIRGFSKWGKRTFNINMYVLNSSYTYAVPTEITVTVSPGVDTGVDDIAVDSCESPAEYYNIQGMRVAEPRQGQIVIVRRGTKITKEVYRQ